MQVLTDDERKTWAAAVSAYAAGLSKLDAVRGEPFPTITAALAMADDAPALSGVDAGATETLTRAAPIYRKAWWPAHRAANRAWQSSIEALIDCHGAAVRDVLVKWYGLPWPADGYAVHLVVGLLGRGRRLLIL